ncbi:hypothetical protein AVEN_158520-1 [Araneus ventricosus]|uniref:Uncharacterized protein n=1 Tax=Araneus ventricosus TaxID=182803 RepID=A0A4Y2GJE6_ARAVE|nr:hypothetical protein AVEN_158520-1 [Araneus ventricosus]
MRRGWWRRRGSGGGGVTFVRAAGAGGTSCLTLRIPLVAMVCSVVPERWWRWWRCLWQWLMVLPFAVFTFICACAVLCFEQTGRRRYGGVAAVFGINGIGFGAGGVSNACMCLCAYAVPRVVYALLLRLLRRCSLYVVWHMAFRHRALYLLCGVAQHRRSPFAFFVRAFVLVPGIMRCHFFRHFFNGA